MGGEPDIEARMETVAHRVEFVELLAEAGPLQPRDLVDELPHSRPTVTRALRELREAGLVETGQDGYTASLAGVLAADEYRRYESASRAILSARDLLAPIPESDAFPVEVLVDGSTILADENVPVRALEAVSDRVQGAERVRAYLPTLVNTHLLRVWHRSVISGNVEGAGLFDPDLLTILKGQYPHLLSEMANASGFEAFAASGPPYGVVLTTTGEESSMALVVYEEDTSVRGVLTNDDPGAVDWARSRLDGLEGEATEATGDLQALSAAVADGVARIPATGSTAHTGAAEAPDTADAGRHSLPIDLEAEGFVRLSETYFETHGEVSPAVSWRTGFTLADVQAGHAVDRLDGDGRPLTTRIVEMLQAGTDAVVLGPPGSGKSTVCMAVACEWYERDLGPVLYRERGSGDRFESTALLEATLRQADGHALVVVEDAVRDEANAVFEVVETLDADPSVTVLLDARTHEWRNPGAFDLDPRRDAYRRGALEAVSVPSLDETACERFVRHFTDLVGEDLELTGRDLYELVESGDATADGGGIPAGDAIVAQHYLAQRYDPAAGVETAAPTALDEATRRTYRTLADGDSRLVAELAVLVALLTAGGIPVAPEYLYGAASDTEYDATEDAISRLEGRLLFEADRPRAGTPSTYRTRHETWAMRFLEQVSDVESPADARQLVGVSLTRFLSLADDPDRRARIEQHLGGRTPHLHRIDADPGHWADELAERVFGIGRTNASLAPLFGETTDGALELPAACSPWTRVQQAYWRGEMNRVHGDLARAEREFRTLEELVEELRFSTGDTTRPAVPEFTSREAVSGDDVATHRMRWRATSRDKLGEVARERGDYETAADHHQEAYLRFSDIDERAGEATSLKNLGIIAFYQADHQRAREYYERSLDIAKDLDADRIRAECLNNLGGVAWKQGDYDGARECLERSLAISRDLGDREAEFSSLNNLGDIAQAQGEYERAREYYEQSLAIFRDLGHQRGEATTLNNLGQVARRLGAYDQASEFFEGSLSLKRDLGDRNGEAETLRNLGEVARDRGWTDRASEYFAESLAIERDIDDRQGEADSLLALGTVAFQRGDLEDARDRARDSLEIARDIDASAIEARSHVLLARIALDRDQHEAASESLDAARETFESIGSRDGKARVRLVEGRLALARGNLDDARQQARGAHDSFAELESPLWRARSRRLRGRVAAAADDTDTAREHLQTALETFEPLDATPDVLETAAALVETCRAAGEEDSARKWCQRARDVVGDAPGPTAARHRDWIERHATELEGE